MMDYNGFITLAKSLLPGITPEMEARFEALEGLYNDWNARINVISRKDIGSLYMRHVMHSLAIAGYLKAIRPEMYEGLCSGRIDGCPASVLDIGTGGGFPGIPLSIMFPECYFKLIDGTGKKIKVANEIAHAIGLENCHPEHLRGEDEKDKYDFVVSRAVMQLPDLIKIVKKNVRPKGNNALPNGVICLKGGNLDAELQDFRKIVQTTELTNWFEEEWFKDKYFIYLPL